MPEPQNPFHGRLGRRLAARHDKRTAAQVDAHVQARAPALDRRVADRAPVGRVSATRIDARIAKYVKTIRAKHPEAPGT